jgi:chromosome partitioning protein
MLAFGRFNFIMIFAIASQKGGVGKTSTSISLAAGIAHKGKKVLLVDIDSQANSSKVLIKDYQTLKKESTIYTTILERSPLPVHKTQIDTLDIIPSHILLSNTDVELTTAIDHREARLKKALDLIKHQYEYIFIDCPPTLSWLTINAMTAADKVIVVVSPGYFELDSIVQIRKTVEEVKELFNSNLELAGFLFNMSDPTLNSKTSLQILRQTYTSSLFNTVIPRNTDLRDAHFNKQDIFSFNAKSPAAQAYEKFIKELLTV